jgi:hypothetical protein
MDSDGSPCRRQLNSERIVAAADRKQEAIAET